MWEAEHSGESVDLRPTEDVDAHVLTGFTPTINQGWVGRQLSREGTPTLKPLEKITVEGLPRLDLYRLDLSSTLNEQIHLVAVAVPPETQAGDFPTVQEHLEQFTDHKGLKDSSSQGVGRELPVGLQSQQPAEQAGIMKEQLRRFGETLVEIDVMRAQQEQQP